MNQQDHFPHNVVAIEKLQNSKHVHTPLTQIYKSMMAQQSVDQIDSRPLKGLPTSLYPLLYDWDFDTFKAQVGHTLSEQGQTFVYLLNTKTPSGKNA